MGGNEVFFGPEPMRLSSDSLAAQELLPGDILLVRPAKPNCVHRRITEETGSHYTHACIYVGKGVVAEANFPKVRRLSLWREMKGCLYVGVLRTQMVFTPGRAELLDSFVKRAIRRISLYDLLGAKKWQKTRKHFDDNALELVRANYGKFKDPRMLANQSFFCSAFVVACYMAVDIIGPSAQSAYPQKAFSPSDLYSDPTFGYTLGFLVPEGHSVPPNDPLKQITQWDDQDWKWW